jgi:hypothetical protein
MWTRKAYARASAGSQKWLQTLVNEYPKVINRRLASRLDLRDESQIEWRSPLEADEYAEYRDRGFVDRLEIQLPTGHLQDFWPRGGPVWDGLARTKQAPPHLLLVEAKAHVSELASDPCGAISATSQTRIRDSLADTQRFLHVGSENDWTGGLYQYANRLAHLYWLRECNALNAYLLFIYFTGDQTVGGPGTESEWQAALELRDALLARRARGRWQHRLSRYVLEEFIDVRQLGGASRTDSPVSD